MKKGKEFQRHDQGRTEVCSQHVSGIMKENHVRNQDRE
jgi:hypothetical protein